jgi:hypothetical protein
LLATFLAAFTMLTTTAPEDAHAAASLKFQALGFTATLLLFVMQYSAHGP